MCDIDQRHIRRSAVLVSGVMTEVCRDISLHAGGCQVRLQRYDTAITGDVTLTGTGTVRMSNVFNEITASAANYRLTNENTIVGSGIISELALTNRGTAASAALRSPAFQASAAVVASRSKPISRKKLLYCGTVM